MNHELFLYKYFIYEKVRQENIALQASFLLRFVSVFCIHRIISLLGPFFINRIPYSSIWALASTWPVGYDKFKE